AHTSRTPETPAPRTPRPLTSEEAAIPLRPFLPHRLHRLHVVAQQAVALSRNTTRPLITLKGKSYRLRQCGTGDHSSEHLKHLQLDSRRRSSRLTLARFVRQPAAAIARHGRRAPAAPAIRRQQKRRPDGASPVAQSVVASQEPRRRLLGGGHQCPWWLW